MSFRSRGLIAAIFAVVVATSLLSGCATFDRRGGLLAAFGDWSLFPAHTKSHRLLRAYIVTAALATIARNVGTGAGDKQSVSGRLRAALEAEQEAYDCLYPDRARLHWTDYTSLTKVSSVPPIACIFFDERQARINYAVYKLAAEVLTDPESQALFNDVRERLLGGLPVVGAAIRTASKAVNTTKEAATTVLETTSVVDSLINLSIKVAPRYVYLAPIYRDALELDMRLTVDALREQCGNSAPASAACVEWGEGEKLLVSSDDLNLWRGFLDRIALAQFNVEAYPVHFAIVTRWLYSACTGLYAGATLTPGKIDKTKINVAETLKAINTAINDNCSPLIEFVPLSETPPYRNTIKIAYTQKRNGEEGTESKDDHDVNASRRSAPRVIKPAQVPIPPEAAKARGEMPAGKPE